MARRCSYCYGSGHNRRTCTKLKEYCKENPDTYTAKVAERKAANAKTRTCSYCLEEGHNRKTCQSLIIDKAKAIKENAAYRAGFLQYMQEKGFGISALLKDRHNQLYLVESIDWDHITPWKNARAQLRPFGRTRSYGDYIRLSLDFLHDSNNFKIVSVATLNAIKRSMPATWLNGFSGVDERFEKR
jgi:hypothetical protein